MRKHNVKRTANSFSAPAAEAILVKARNAMHRAPPATAGAGVPPPGGAAFAGTQYVVDALQRSVLFLDLLRQRGNEEAEITSRPLATVLRYKHEMLMSGLTLKRPMNYSLYRIVPPPGVMVDARQRPVVVIDPRAGQGPGIGGLKAESEIGEALQAGHPVYFIAFSALPVRGQQFLDVVEGQVAFFERIVERHPDAPRPFAFGNCQAGYQTLMVAMLRPDLFGPVLVAGSPMSYWQGVRGKNPMRYAGGLLGGSWLTALAGDLGNGKIDGTSLILNFDMLNPANWLWGKQYEVYTHVDTDAERYLEFEKWWGDFIELGSDELQFLVDKLFIGDQLARGELQSSDGTVFDFRNITSPIIVFTSMGDNISPPQQALGWIPEVYRDAADIRDSGRTIVYCLDEHVGHLAIFVSGKVGAKNDEEFVRMMDVIEALPPGLYEMVISPAQPGTFAGASARASDADPVGGAWRSRFEARTLDHIRALGRNSAQDDRAFAAVARLSELNLARYRSVMQPLVRVLATQQAADLTRALNPLRLNYTMFGDRNPWMAGVKALAASVAKARAPVADDNPLLAIQSQVSEHIVAALDRYRVQRDQLQEQTFFAFYGSPLVQALLGISSQTAVRPQPGPAPAKVPATNTGTKSHKVKRTKTGVDAALTLVGAIRVRSGSKAAALAVPSQRTVEHL